jgi:hypothetical protein
MNFALISRNRTTDNLVMTDRNARFDAYERTTYFADGPAGRFGIRDCQLSPEADDLLRRHGATTWAFVTAYNPHARRLSDADNAARHDQLCRAVRERGHVTYDGEGIGDDGTWPPERSLLILGISRSSALQLGADFEQDAIVIGVLGEVARVVACPLSRKARCR